MSGSDFTARLGLPYLLPNQAQKHVTVNESLRGLDMMVMTAIERQGLTQPPEAPDEGMCWLVAAGADGAWQNMDGRIAGWADGAWHFFTPVAGWRVYDKADAVLIVYDGERWAAVSGDTQGLALIGLATLADEANPFAARLNAALFTAREVADAGTGDLRLSLNKESAANVGAILFQSGFSGRAEIGLAGDEDFRVRVSQDGASWQDAVQIDRASGRVGIGGPPGNTDQLQVHGRFQASSAEGYFLLRDNGILDMARHSGGAVYLRGRSSGSTMNFGVTDTSGTLTNNAISIRPDPADVLFAFHVCPTADGSADLGQAGRAWRDLYLVNAPTVTSDRRTKTDIEDLPDASALIEFLRPVSYRRAGATKRRFGFVAQEVKLALEACGLGDAGLWHLADPGCEDSLQMLVQEELIAVLVSAVQRLTVRVDQLENGCAVS